jgi:hypothetical protein
MAYTFLTRLLAVRVSTRQEISRCYIDLLDTGIYVSAIVARRKSLPANSRLYRTRVAEGQPYSQDTCRPASVEA